MYNLFEYFYSPEGTTTYFSIAFLYLIVAAITTVLFAAFLTVAIRTKKKWAIILSVLLFLISYPALTPFFEQRAVYKLAGVRMFDQKGLQAAYSTMYNDFYNKGDTTFFEKNKKEFLTNEEIAAKLSVFPSQKGFIYLNIAREYNLNDFQNAKKYYDKAYKALGSYKSQEWLIPMVTYYSWGDFDKAIEIAEVHRNYGLIAQCYIMKNDYNKALETINKELSIKPNNPWVLVTRANIYRNLGNSDKAAKDYQSVLKNSEKYPPISKARLAEQYNDKDYTRHQWETSQKRRESRLNQK